MICVQPMSTTELGKSNYWNLIGGTHIINPLKKVEHQVIFLLRNTCCAAADSKVCLTKVDIDRSVLHVNINCINLHKFKLLCY